MVIELGTRRTPIATMPQNDGADIFSNDSIAVSYLVLYMWLHFPKDPLGIIPSNYRSKPRPTPHALFGALHTYDKNWRRGDSGFFWATKEGQDGE